MSRWIPALRVPALGAALLVGSLLGASDVIADVPEPVPRVIILDADATVPVARPLLLRQRLDPEARAPNSGPLRWQSVSGRPVDPGSAAPPGGVVLHPVELGEASVPLRDGAHEVDVLAARFERPDRRPTARLAIARELPRELLLPGVAAPRDESVRLVLAGWAASLPVQVDLIAESPWGTFLDSVRGVPLSSVPCPKGLVPQGAQNVFCAATPYLRVVTDAIERNHPALAGTAVLGEVGGIITVNIHDTAAYRVRVAAPHALDPNGPGRYFVKVRARIVRTFAGGPPAVGADDAEAIQIVRDEIASASRMWGQCGVSLGRPEELDVRVIDPPTLSLLTVGCGRAVNASGGQIAILVGGKRVVMKTYDGQTPESVASRLSALVRRTGVEVRLFRNAQVSRAAASSFDLVFSDARGRPVSLGPAPGQKLSDDPTLQVCHGRLNLADGLEHFNDENAASGTMEERMLLRAIADADPATIELVVVPVFGGLGRIGESFIRSQGGSVENALILDRTGVRAGSRSFTLAHELGHILLDLPGHPDDFGVDTPTSLMDADAADPTIFGPRRLSLEDCRRGLRQSGKNAPTQLIFDWELP